jgi:hypothetical protein
VSQAANEPASNPGFWKASTVGQDDDDDDDNDDDNDDDVEDEEDEEDVEAVLVEVLVEFKHAFGLPDAAPR